ncbi:MAG: glycine--tRNA ligase [Thermoplasmatales archaeon]|nr:glycine--tRNA ligase [Thermoplasmatales archaeon]
MTEKTDIYEKIMALAKRRGFIYPSYEIYGGETGFYDYGPLGCLMKNNIENEWRNFYVIKEGFYEISTPVITPYAVLKASGHVDKFIDEIGYCKKCELSFKVEELKNGLCPICGGNVERSEINLMFETGIGRKKERAFLRPETAQGIFVNFPFLYEFSRKKIPFGIVQIGKGFRNEVSPRQGMIRLREFSMAEAEIFFGEENKKHAKLKEFENEEIKVVYEGREEKIKLMEGIGKIFGNEAIAYYLALTKKFLVKVGIHENKIRFRKHEKNELAHYANECWDAEVYSERFGWIECVGIADRQSYDLEAHMKATGFDMNAIETFDEPIKVRKKVVKLKMDKIGKLFREKAKIIKEKFDGAEFTGKLSIEIDGEIYEIGEEFYEIVEKEENVYLRKFLPHVIEPSYGIDRIFYFIMEHNYMEKEKEGEKYVILSIPPNIAPIKAGVFPLLPKDGLPEIAKEIESSLRRNKIICFYDESGSIGRRYARMDEIGTPFCITVDYQTKEDDTVTIRFRDTSEQIRIKREDVAKWIEERIR